MLKNSTKSLFSNDRPVYLYDRVRNDIFGECHNEETTTIPSITTILLLQLQASIIKILTILPPKEASQSQGRAAVSMLEAYAPLCLIRQSMRWLLLLGLLFLDNLARLLDVEHEMNRISSATREKKKYKQTVNYENEAFFRRSSLSVSSSSSSTANENEINNNRNHNHNDISIMKQCYDNNSNPYGSSGVTIPTLTRCSRPCCTTSDPQNITIYSSPPPSSPSAYTLSSSYNSRSQSPEERRVREKRISLPSSYKQRVSHEKSPVLPPTTNTVVYSMQQQSVTDATGHHTRSLSSNSSRFSSNKKSPLLVSSQNINSIRRTTAQREINATATAVVGNQQRNTVLKETSAWANKKHSHPYHHSATSSVASSSGSSCEFVRPTMKKTRSATTENIQSRSRERIQKPYERCCPACISAQHN